MLASRDINAEIARNQHIVLHVIRRRFLAGGVASRDLYEDMLQDGTIGLWKTLLDIRENDPDFVWIASGRVHRSIVDGIRRRLGRRAGRLETVPLDDVIEELFASDDRDLSDELLDLERGMASLTEQQRAVITGLYVDEKSVELIARDLGWGWTRPRIMGIRDRALLRLRREMGA